MYVIGISFSLIAFFSRKNYFGAIEVFAILNLGLVVVGMFYIFFMNQVLDFEITNKGIYFILFNNHEIEFEDLNIVEIRESSQRIVLILANRKKISILKRYLDITNYRLLSEYLSSQNLPNPLRRTILY
jgi:hypothetical protein